MERRAVQVTHELWQQMFTEGYTSGSIRCVKGLPEDAKLVGHTVRDFPPHDAVFIFESEQWGLPDSDWGVGIDGETYWGFEVVFEAAQCRTCKKFTPGIFADMGQQSGLCSYLAVSTFLSFGCTQYEPRETDD